MDFYRVPKKNLMRGTGSYGAIIIFSAKAYEEMYGVLLKNSILYLVVVTYLLFTSVVKQLFCVVLSRTGLLIVY